MVQIKKFNIRDEVQVEYNGHWYSALIIQPKNKIEIKDDEYWVHYVGWNKKYDDVVHAEIIRLKSEMPEIPDPPAPAPPAEDNHNTDKPKNKSEKKEPQKRPKSAGPSKRKASASSSAGEKNAKKPKINLLKKRHKTNSKNIQNLKNQNLQNGNHQVAENENNGESSSQSEPIPKITWASQKRDMIAAMKSNGFDKTTIDDIVRKWSHDINKAINRITQKHIGNQSEYRSCIKIEPEDSDVINYADFTT